MCSTPPSLRATPSKTEGEFLFAEVTIGSSPVLGEVSRSDGGVKNYPQISVSFRDFRVKITCPSVLMSPKKCAFPRENNFQFSTILRLSA